MIEKEEDFFRGNVNINKLKDYLKEFNNYKNKGKWPIRF